ncbi:hypothetical protein [Mycoplasmopsis pullorum]|uniref:Uncharacterized protein n=1 Tax=Mycoplasmopsis pullorum TaxID=48003 RepID=A0A1L4FSX7_9BACT|nr:hypothetical protein [Mycoplasmopsis pullorum]APJ38699.1 hypothetical protein BLA55_03500 [Mycoplasmopsis pullorum]
MKFEKEQALNLLEKWNQNDKEQSLKSTVLQNSHIPEIYTVPFEIGVFEYFDYLKTLIQESENNLLDEIFEKLDYEIPDIAESNINIRCIHLKDDAFAKMDYLIENDYECPYHSKPPKRTIYKVLQHAEYHMIEDFLFEFHDQFKKEFTKELDL